MSWMPPTKSQVRQWNFDSLIEQGSEWSRAAQTVADQHAVISRQLADSPGFWRGSAGDAMRVKSEEAKSSLSKVVEALENAGPATSQAVHALGYAKSAAVNTIQAAEDERYTVDETGFVTYDVSVLAWMIEEKGLAMHVAQAILKQGARLHQEAIVKALREAGDATASAREAIGRIFADVPIPPDAELDAIINNYQVEPDPEGLVDWPDGDLLEQLRKIPWLGENIPQEKVTVSEAAMLDRLSLLDQAKFFMIQKDAKAACEELYPDTYINRDGDEVKDTQDNHADAFRHAYWNARMTQEFGEEWTTEYASKHEGRADNAAVREAMDLYNNELGRKIATANPDASPEELQDLVKDAVDNGDTVIIDESQKLNWTNQVTPDQDVNSDAYDDNREKLYLPGAPTSDNRPSPK
ncbi:WXG100 family type VII secretion target [Nocardia shimofusensis]|uniref:WXG100 family type VII secretion target n=1 Tax=Nocardia shimofusensis TaxID=228596 RepID=UPI000B165439|nr:hypothetical protein [Nocardia shimofusensis]